MNRGTSTQHQWRPALRATALWVVALSSLIAICGLAPVWSQSNARPTVTVAAAITGEPATQVALRIRVGPSAAVPPHSFLRIRGLPAMIALSEGHSIAPGTWAVALTALPNLKLFLPEGTDGRSEIVITLVALDGAVLAETKSSLIITTAQRDTATPPTAASILRAETSLQPKAPPVPLIATPPLKHRFMTPQDLERAQRLVMKGDQELTEGNVANARLFYQRAADAGLPEAAMALAATYDATELARFKVRGVPADPKEARRWYERARELGAGEAEQRLRQPGTQ
jgi:hypothetical protein